ncbi:MAG: hypothetical protein MI924_06360 [Chloroflexales bacterium]|nr:hypothetical protein [Chloroflexales bacterium]
MIERIHYRYVSDHMVSLDDLPPVGRIEDRRHFFSALSDSNQFMFHGSQRGTISALSPKRESSDSSVFGNKQQVFATPDIFWAMWFALLVRGQVKSTHNGCFIDRGKRITYCQFAIDAESYSVNPCPLSQGWIYVLSRETFTSRNMEVRCGELYLAEFGSSVPVTPITKIEVHPSDFPYAALIQPYNAAQ